MVGSFNNCSTTVRRRHCTILLTDIDPRPSSSRYSRNQREYNSYSFDGAIVLFLGDYKLVCTHTARKTRWWSRFTGMKTGRNHGGVIKKYLIPICVLLIHRWSLRNVPNALGTTHEIWYRNRRVYLTFWRHSDGTTYRNYDYRAPCG